MRHNDLSMVNESLGCTELVGWSGLHIMTAVSVSGQCFWGMTVE